MNLSISPVSSPKLTPVPYLTGVTETDKRINEIMQKYFKENVLHTYVSGSDGCELSLSYSVGMSFSFFYPNRGLAREFLKEASEVLSPSRIRVTGPTVNELIQLNFTCVSSSYEDIPKEPQIKKSRVEISLSDQEFSKSLDGLLTKKPFREVYEALVKYIGYDPLNDSQGTAHFIQHTQNKHDHKLSSYLRSRIVNKLNSIIPTEYIICTTGPNKLEIRKVNFRSFEDMDDIELTKLAHCIIDACFSLKTQFDLNKEEFRKKLESF